VGGRGGSSSIGVPRMKNPAGIPSNAITEDEFLGLRGVSDSSSGYVLDKLRGNRQLKTQRGQDRFHKEVQKAEEAYQQKRANAKAEYKRLIDSGKIRDKTPIEKRLMTAHGHPDLQSTQAARRVLEKRGIDWRTGKKKK
jgi:hypothetical protein